jgi:hypothetical protein
MSDPTTPVSDVIPLPRPAPVLAATNRRPAQSLVALVTPLHSHPEQSQRVHHYKSQAAPDNAANRAVVHHTSSQNVMAGSKQFQRGVRVKGVVSRNSKQGIKLQAKRNAKRDLVAPSQETKKAPKSKSKSQKKGGKRT